MLQCTLDTPPPEGPGYRVTVDSDFLATTPSRRLDGRDLADGRVLLARVAFPNASPGGVAGPGARSDGAVAAHVVKIAFQAALSSG